MVGVFNPAPGSHLTERYKFLHEIPQYATSDALSKVQQKLDQAEAEFQEMKAQKKKLKSSSYAALLPEGLIFTLAMLIAFNGKLLSLLDDYKVAELQIVSCE